jgi:hypothetical protein|tara:strand:- start:48 stop:467 length:420 start_codon:yes stop_codon:yes gene_type:complete
VQQDAQRQKQNAATRLQKESLPKARRKIKQGIQTLKRWKEETEPLNVEELKKCPKHVREVLCTKETRNIAGIKRAVERTQQGDDQLGTDVQYGFPCFRNPTVSNSFPSREKAWKGERADLPVSSFETTARELKKMRKPG